MGLSSKHLRVSGAFIIGSAALFAATSAQANLTIIPTFDSSITSSSNAAQIEATLNQVCAFYNANFTDNDTVHITFTNFNSGLGSNHSLHHHRPVHDLPQRACGRRHNDG